MVQIAPETISVLADLTRLITVGMFGLNLWFIRGAFQDLRKLREDVFGKDGVNQRLARVEGVQETMKDE